jgi:hypothetical protein
MAPLEVGFFTVRPSFVSLVLSGIYSSLVLSELYSIFDT